MSKARPSGDRPPFLNIFRDIFTMIGGLILLCGLSIGAAQVNWAVCAAEG